MIMNWFMSLFRGRMVNKGLQQQMRGMSGNMLGRRTLMSVLALAGGAIAYGAARRNNRFGNMIQRFIQPLRNR